MWTEWLNKAFTELSGTDDALFHNVWQNRRLLFDGLKGIGDMVDFYSARLIASAIRSNKRLLVILPDFKPHRPAFLFATALIRHFLDEHSPSNIVSRRSDTVLYFGPHIGIREQLQRTSVQGLGIDLASVFSQQDIRRGASNVGRVGPTREPVGKRLPRVITVYSPVDPITMMKTYNPCWIAIDCSDVGSMAWLQPLLQEAVRQGIPVVAWGQNALSDCINDFSVFGYSFIWPPNSPRILTGELDTLLNSKDRIDLEPLVLCGKLIDPFSTSLSKARQFLISATQRLTNKENFKRDAVTVHWKYFRSLESLPVPVDFYEVEAPYLWGLQSLHKLATVCSHFRNATLQADDLLYHDLEEAAVLLQEAQNHLENLGCGLWEALLNLCLEDPVNDEARILVFPSNSKKQIFLFGMLARNNTTDDDLREMMMYVTSLNELRHWTQSYFNSSNNDSEDSLHAPSANSVWHPILVGLPSQYMTPRLLATFLHPKVDIVLYPHQCSTLMRRQEEWSARLGGDFTRNVETLKRMTNVAAPTTAPVSQSRISVVKPTEMNVESCKKTRTTLTGAVWQPEDPAIEVGRLFQPDEEYESEELILKGQTDADTSSTFDAEEEIWCAEAVRVQFDQGWYGYFALDDKMNIITNSGLDSRYVRSLRPGERALIINGQQRQSLYDLIISRVHMHPSFELHLAMIRRWKEELKVTYVRWRMTLGEANEIRAYGTHNIDGLLKRMQARGSMLTSSLTITQWINGFVLCPLDPEDLRRIGEVLNMRFVQQHYKRISQAASRLRGLHRGLSNRLNRWLQGQVSAVIQGNDDDIIDADLDLTFGDIRNSLLVLNINKIENENGPFLRSTLGLVEKEI